jgi:hypothetical protein
MTMSQYATYDVELLKLIQDGVDQFYRLDAKLRHLGDQVNPRVGGYRVLDRRLQSLRKRGVIYFEDNRWHLTETE